jgi:hypothetical protein
MEFIMISMDTGDFERKDAVENLVSQKCSNVSAIEGEWEIRRHV